MQIEPRQRLARDDHRRDPAQAPEERGQWRRRLAGAYAAAIEGLDAVVTCTAVALPPRMIDAARPPFLGAGGPLITPPFSVAGVPALSVCMGFADGLPLGLQIAGRAFADATVLRIGHAYEQATPWRERRPPPPQLVPDPKPTKRRAASDGPSPRVLAQARAVVAAMRARLPDDLAYDDEPSTVFRP